MRLCSLTNPVFYEDAQIEGWKKVTDAVHQKDGKIFLQIWHGGRACPKEYNDGMAPVAPSPITISHPYFSTTVMGYAPSSEPRALTDDEALRIVDAFGDCAKRAMKAGFDGVEIHGANGYLVDNFFSAANNNRPSTSRYSGESFETRSRFALDVVDACTAAIGADRVGIRLGPHITDNDAKWEKPEEDAAYIAKILKRKEIAFVHLLRRDNFAKDRDMSVDITPVFVENFGNGNPKGVVITNVDFEREEAERYVDEGKADAIVFGVPFKADAIVFALQS